MGMGSGAIEAGKAFVKFLLDDKELKKGIAGIGRTIQKSAAIGLAASLPLLATFGAFANTFANAGSEIYDMSQRTGIAAEALSELQFAAKANGVEFNSFEKSVKRMQKSVGDATLGQGTFGKTIKQLGLNLADLKKQDPEGQFMSLAGAVSAIEDPSVRAAMAIEVFGKSGTEILPLFEDGPAGLAKLRDEARRLGITMSSQSVKAADELGDALDAAKAQTKALAINIGAAVAGPLSLLLQVTAPIVAGIIHWIQKCPILFQAIAVVTGAVVALSSALLAVGTGMTLYKYGAIGAKAATYAFAKALKFASAHPVVLGLAAIAAVFIEIKEAIADAEESMTKFLIRTARLSGALIPSIKGKLDATAIPMPRIPGGAMPRRSGSIIPPAAAAAARAGANAGDSPFLKQIADNTLNLIKEIRNSPGFIGGVS